MIEAVSAADLLKRSKNRKEKMSYLLKQITKRRRVLLTTVLLSVSSVFAAFP